MYDKNKTFEFRKTLKEAFITYSDAPGPEEREEASISENRKEVGY